jgi:hypothetical protein
MTPDDLAQADVAFVGTVIATGTSGPEILNAWPAHICHLLLRTSLDHGNCDQIETAVFDVEEAIRGVRVSTQYEVPQSGGADCATYYRLGQRYVWASTGINGQVWTIKPGVTAAQAITDWRPRHQAGLLLE